MTNNSFAYRGRRLFVGLAAVAAALTLGGSAQAETVYAFAQQSVSSVGITVNTGTLTVLNSFGTSATGATIVDGPVTGAVGQSGALDALQSYVGAVGTAPAQNFFGQKGQIDADYARGDVLIGSTSLTAAAADSVAESYLSTPLTNFPADLGDGSNSWAIAATVTLSAATTLNLAATYANLIELISVGENFGTADFSFNITIRSLATGLEAFRWVPAALNDSDSIIGSGTFSQNNSGTASITTGTLAAGNYQITIAGGSRVSTAVVPEPSSWVMLSMGVVGLMGYGWRRRRLASLATA